MSTESLHPRRMILGTAVIASFCWAPTVLAVFQMASLFPSDGVLHDRYGHAVAVSGTLGLVGAPGRVSHVGSVYIVDLTNPAVPIAGDRIYAPDLTGHDNFGEAIDLQGSLALIGAPRRRNATNASCGGVYFIDFSDPESPIALGAVSPVEGTNIDSFGQAVAWDGDLAIIGSPGISQSGKSAGGVYIYRVSTQERLARYVPTVASGSTVLQMGGSVDIRGTIAIAGAPLASDAAINAGAVFLMDLSDPEHPVVQRKLASDAGIVDYFGTSVALGDGIAVVGAPRDNDNGLVDSGSVYFLNSSTGAQLGKLHAPVPQAGAQFGGFVRIEGNVLIVGSPYWDWTEFNNPDCGTIDLFDIADPANPVHITSLLVGAIKSYDALGEAVAISGSRIVAGVPVGTNEALVATGAAYTFYVQIPAPGCPGDINGDDLTNAADFTILAGTFGSAVAPNTSGDLNGDGLVNAADFVILAGDFGCEN